MASRGRGGEFKRGHRGDSRRHNRDRSRDNKRERQPKPDVDESSPIIQAFLGHRTDLDNRHDKYERLVKLSRDVTIESKRSIFLLHRMSGEEEKTKVIEETETKLKELEETKWKQIAKELYNEDAYQFLRAYSPGLQEYIEAVSFLHYLKTGGLISVDEVQKRLVFTEVVQPKEDKETAMEVETSTPTETKEEQSTESGPETSKSTSDSAESKTEDTKVDQPSAASEGTERVLRVHVDPIEYILGLADLTGELMRMAIHSVGTGDLTKPFEHCNFMRVMHDAFVSFGNAHRELPRKLYTLKASLRKVEAACYALQVRGSEIPKHMLADVFTVEKEYRVDDDLPTPTD